MTQHTASGAGAPTSVPPSLGAHYTDTETGDQYLAKGTASVADWIKQARVRAPVVSDDPVVSVDASVATTYVVTLLANASVTLAGAGAGTRVELLFVQAETGGHSVAWPADTIEWAEGTDGMVAGDAGRATGAVLLSLGNGKWVGSKRLYGEAVATATDYYALLWNTDTAVHVGLFNLDGSQVGQVQVASASTYTLGSISLNLTDDGRYIAVSFSDSGVLSIVDTADWSVEQVSDVPVSASGPTNRYCALVGHILYGIDGLSLYRVDLETATKSAFATLLQAPQSISASGSELTATLHNMMGPMAIDPNVMTQTYDLATGNLLASQYGMPSVPAEFSATGASAYMGAGGAYSPDGSKFAVLCVPFSDSGIGNGFRPAFVVYDVATKAVLSTVVIPDGEIDWSKVWYYNPMWSPDGKYFGALCDAGDANDNAVVLLDLDTSTIVYLSESDTGITPNNSYQLMLGEGGLVIYLNTTATVVRYDVDSGAASPFEFAPSGDGATARYFLSAATN